ncbi:hypothetical protein [Kordia sp. SMS9]|uniref:hypothetical protein n=1 Tax=Kordia sp. SMS9 TaxID=2282170 RepID=UPI0013B3C2F7|nr:hypothetical protein [Kordia sp. SMS9]
MRTTSLRKMAKNDITKYQKRALKRLDAEDLEMIKFLVKKIHKEKGKKRDENYYNEGCTALFQYYTTAILDPFNMHAISDELDDFWHAHVIDTVSYDLLCKDLGFFMHHDPLNPKDIKKEKDVKIVYEYTRRKVLPSIFGEKNLSKIFHPIKTKLVCLHDLEITNHALFSVEGFFPEHTKMQTIKAKYGHAARKLKIRQGLLKRKFI